MKISFNWLKEYIRTDLGAEEVANILTDTGLEVEGLEMTETIRGGLEGVVVGHVLTCGKHPDADKLSLTTVDVGTGEPLQIVCGAPNVAAGQKVPVATIGATLYPAGEAEGFKIKRSKIRGVESMGMICAEDELGLGSSHDGIIVLAEDAIPGTPLKEYYQIQDEYTLEIGLTPNRADAMSHYGVARDLAAYLKSNDLPYTLTLPDVSAFAQDNSDKTIPVEVLDAEGAPRYMGVTLTGVKVGPSPEWLQARLRAIGLNPHNNVVDITNYVLHGLGQPLHAFDAGRIKGGKIVVRTCPEGTPFITLDGVERKLSAEDLMICNAEAPMCLAGIFGGMDSGVTETTTEVFLEAAYFNPRRIRISARRHGLSTDASFRFERGIDPDMTPVALRCAALLIRELAGGKISSPVSDAYPKPIAPFRFDISFDRTNRLIGKDLPEETIRKIIGALDIRIESENAGTLSVAVPPYRVDVQREADLIEDILRIYGYNNIEMPQQVRSSLSYAPHPDKDKLVALSSDMLSAKGFNEIMSNSLTKASYYEELQAYPAGRCVKILNPLSNDLNVMRQTLLFNALEAAQLNTNHRNGDLKLYEFGNCYSYAAEKAPEGALAPYGETWRLGIFITGADHAASWNQASQPTSFFTLKATAEQLLRRLGFDLESAQMEPLESDLYREAVAYKIQGKRMLEMGVVAPKLRKQFDLKGDAYFLEMDFGALVKATRKHKITVQELPKYPEVRRDLALLLDSSVSFAQLRSLAFSTERKLLKEVSLFDVYEGDKLPEGKKSYALSFVLCDPAQTLVDQQIDKTMNALIQAFEQKLGAKIR